jgi:hypothetical protein
MGKIKVHFQYKCTHNYRVEINKIENMTLLSNNKTLQSIDSYLFYFTKNI